MKAPSLTIILSGIFLAYIAHSIWTMYNMFNPASCSPAQSKHCTSSYLERNAPIEISVYGSKYEKIQQSDLVLLWRMEEFDPYKDAEIEVNVSIPLKTRSNGTYYAHAFVSPKGESLESGRSSWRIHKSVLLTTYALPQAETFQLIGNQTEKKTNDVETDKPVSQWRSRLTLSIMTDKISLDLSALTSDIGQHIMLWNSNDEYLPVLFIDELSNRIRDLRPLNKSSKEMPLTIIYQPISIGKLRLWSNMKESLATLRNLGFTEKDSDEVKSIFVDTNLYLLLLTFVVAAFHLLFDFLAFKNDINYWRKRESMAGLSVRTVVWRCVSTIIIFLYLMDEQTSLLVLIPAGIGSVIEIWKVLKAFKVKLSWTGWRPHVTLGTATENELATQAFDQQAMKWLLYVLYPLCFAGAIYSLLYTPHKSWFSWCLQSLVNGVYAFGFIFMLPQLFINYKLKSVAHLPWKAFMYKAFNTFIDDIFAFIITMPTAHRLACFRDDIIFVIYLYQRWLYPVDKTRVNEFGQSFENEAGKSESVEKVAHGKNDVGKSESAEKVVHGKGKGQESKKQK